MNWWLLLIPVSSAFSCWLVVKLFFSILFRPHGPKTYAGFKIQGVLPAKQTSIAQKIGKLVAEQLFSMDVIKQKITDPANLQKIMPAIEEHIDDFLRNKLKKEMPIISMFIGDKTVSSLKKVFMAELEILFPQIMNNYATTLADDLNLEALVTQKIISFPIAEMEKGFYQNLSREINMVKLFSALLGLIIGLITMLIISFSI
jgi:uncharacterized membrane protein YheB (UPF0754 family)